MVQRVSVVYELCDALEEKKRSMNKSMNQTTQAIFFSDLTRQREKLLWERTTKAIKENVFSKNQSYDINFT